MKRTIAIGIAVVVMLILTFVFVDRNVKRRHLIGDWTYELDNPTKEKARKILSQKDFKELERFKSRVFSFGKNNECSFHFLKGRLNMGFNSFECTFESGESDFWFETFDVGEKIGKNWVIKFSIQSDKEITQLNKNGEPYMKLVKIIY